MPEPNVEGSNPAQGYLLPVVPIRAERKRRYWTVDTMARKLRAAMDDPEHAPDLESFRQMIHRWERGGCGVSERYRFLYCQVFERSEYDLFGIDPPAIATGTAAIPADTIIPEVDGGNRYVVFVLPPGHHRITIDVADTDEENEPEPEPARRLIVVKDQHGEQYPDSPAIRSPGSPGAERTCDSCGFPLSRYNTGILCQACISAKREGQPAYRERDSY